MKFYRLMFLEMKEFESLYVKILVLVVESIEYELFGWCKFCICFIFVVNNVSFLLEW